MVRLILATNPIPPPDVEGLSGQSFGWMLLWMLLVLVLVVGGMLLATHFLRRFPGLGQRRGVAWSTWYAGDGDAPACDASLCLSPLF